MSFLKNIFKRGPKKEVKRYWFKPCTWCRRLMFIAEFKMIDTTKFYHGKCYQAYCDFKTEMY